MKFLLDENLSPQICLLLEGHDCVHTNDLGLSTKSDSIVLDKSTEEKRILVTADTDFGEILAKNKNKQPSVLLLRKQTGRSAKEIAALITANLEQITEDLTQGALVVLDDEKVRIRKLPIQ
jgi:predicted nuclease of predicted toxin-antitoxin system